MIVLASRANRAGYEVLLCKQKRKRTCVGLWRSHIVHIHYMWML